MVLYNTSGYLSYWPWSCWTCKMTSPQGCHPSPSGSRRKSRRCRWLGGWGGWGEGISTQWCPPVTCNKFVYKSTTPTIVNIPHKPPKWNWMSKTNLPIINQLRIPWSHHFCWFKSLCSYGFPMAFSWHSIVLVTARRQPTKRWLRSKALRRTGGCTAVVILT